MKITAGKFKGITISSVRDKRTRYTPALVREAFYDIINVEQKEMLELFAGSGIMSLEALSRDVKSVTIVEIARASCQTIKSNLSKVNAKAFVMNVDFRIAMKRLEKKGKTFDIIFMDPPFNTGLSLEAFKALDVHSKLLKKSGIAIIESFEKDIPPDEGINILLSSRRHYGDIILSFYRLKA